MRTARAGDTGREKRVEDSGNGWGGEVCGHYVNERVPRRTFGNLTATTANDRPDVARVRGE